MKPNEKESTFGKHTSSAPPTIGVSGVPTDHVITFDRHPREEEPEVPEKAPVTELPRAEVEAEAPKTVPPAIEKPCIIPPAPVHPAPSVPAAPQSESEMAPSAEEIEIIGIRFKKNGKIYYFDPCGMKGEVGNHAIVETSRGQEYGEIALGNTMVPSSDIIPPIRPMLRIATDADIAHFHENKQKEDEAFAICLTKIEAHKLDMKLVEAQYTFDNSKLLFYFTSAGRVDFRELVKDLASVFRTRIELRQIGIRDEAKLVGGIGSCGRALCCARFLTDFGQVSIKMAKEQNLSLNSTKISGTCGRLMCCLRYEYEAYLEEIRLTPPVESVVKTPDGIGTVIEIAPLTGMVKVRLTNNTDTPVQSYHRDTVTVCSGDTDPAKLPHEQETNEEIALKERLSAFESHETSRDSAPHHTAGIPDKKDWTPPAFRKSDDLARESKPASPRPPRKSQRDHTHRELADESISSRNRLQTQQNQQNRTKSHPRKRPAGKPQNRGGKSGGNA